MKKHIMIIGLLSLSTIDISQARTSSTHTSKATNVSSTGNASTNASSASNASSAGNVSTTVLTTKQDILHQIADIIASLSKTYNGQIAQTCELVPLTRIGYYQNPLYNQNNPKENQRFCYIIEQKTTTPVQINSVTGQPQYLSDLRQRMQDLATKNKENLWLMCDSTGGKMAIPGESLASFNNPDYHAPSKTSKAVRNPSAPGPSQQCQLILKKKK